MIVKISSVYSVESLVGFYGLNIIFINTTFKFSYSLVKVATLRCKYAHIANHSWRLAFCAIINRYFKRLFEWITVWMTLPILPNLMMNTPPKA